MAKKQNEEAVDTMLVSKHKELIAKKNDLIKDLKEQISKTAKPETLAEAVLQVMREVKGIEKNLQVGAGKHSYKGVSDKDVKQIIGAAMERAGLVLLPTGIQPTTRRSQTDHQPAYRRIP